MRKELLEGLVISTLKENIFASPQIDIVTDKVFNYLTNNFNKADKEIKRIEKSILKLQEKSNKLLDYSLDGIISDYEYKTKKKEIDMEILNLKREKLEYDTNSETMGKEQIKNHLIELGKNLDSKDDSLVQLIIQTFVKKIIVDRTSVTIHIRLFPNTDMANDGGDDGNRTRGFYNA